MCSIGSVVVFFFFFLIEMTRPSIYNIQIPDVSRVVIFPGMHRKVNSVIIQPCSTTYLVNEPQDAYSIRVGV